MLKLFLHQKYKLSLIVILTFCLTQTALFSQLQALDASAKATQAAKAAQAAASLTPYIIGGSYHTFRGRK